MLTKRKKTTVIGEHQRHKTDTGSADVQVALLSKRIEELTDHLKTHRKDHHSRRGLLKLVGKRKRLMDYLSRKDPKRHASLVRKLGLKR